MWSQALQGMTACVTMVQALWVLGDWGNAVQKQFSSAWISAVILPCVFLLEVVADMNVPSLVFRVST